MGFFINMNNLKIIWFNKSNPISGVKQFCLANLPIKYKF